MAKKNERRRENHEGQLPTTTEINQPRDTSRRFKHWRILVIILLLVLVAVTAGLLRNYRSSAPRECYHCMWIGKPNSTSLSDHPCGRDQRNANSSAIKTCNSNQQFCGTLLLSLSSSTNQGSSKKVDFAFIRDCFTDYPLEYVMDLDNSYRTYHGTREGNTYRNIGGKQLDITIVGKQCSNWNLCNSNQPKVNLAASFLDSITVIEEAKQTVSNAWSALIEFINEAKINFDGSQTAV